MKRKYVTILHSLVELFTCFSLAHVTHNLKLFSPLQLASYIREPGVFALSKDVDVALWLDCRAFSNQPALHEVQEFVVVNHTLLKEFKEFQRSRITPELSYLPAIDLLELWITAQKPLLHLVVMFGKRYARMHWSSIDA